MTADDQNNRNLTSWKEIASFLGVSERTARHWEREKGLPVQRTAGAKGRVSVNVEDLERWREKTLQKIPWYANLKFLRYYAAAATGLFLVARGVLLGIYLAADPSSRPPRKWKPRRIP